MSGTCWRRGGADCVSCAELVLEWWVRAGLWARYGCLGASVEVLDRQVGLGACLGASAEALNCWAGVGETLRGVGLGAEPLDWRR